jgi:hypothetical protein
MEYTTGASNVNLSAGIAVSNILIGKNTIELAYDNTTTTTTTTTLPDGSVYLNTAEGYRVTAYGYLSNASTYDLSNSGDFGNAYQKYLNSSSNASLSAVMLSNINSAGKSNTVVAINTVLTTTISNKYFVSNVYLPSITTNTDNFSTLILSVSALIVDAQTQATLAVGSTTETQTDGKVNTIRGYKTTINGYVGTGNNYIQNITNTYVPSINANLLTIRQNLSLANMRP